MLLSRVGIKYRPIYPNGSIQYVGYKGSGGTFSNFNILNSDAQYGDLVLYCHFSYNVQYDYFLNPEFNRNKIIDRDFDILTNYSISLGWFIYEYPVSRQNGFQSGTTACVIIRNPNRTQPVNSNVGLEVLTSDSFGNIDPSGITGTTAGNESVMFVVGPSGSGGPTAPTGWTYLTYWQSNGASITLYKRSNIPGGDLDPDSFRPYIPGNNNCAVIIAEINKQP